MNDCLLFSEGKELGGGRGEGVREREIEGGRERQTDRGRGEEGREGGR